MPTRPTYPGVYIEEVPSGVRTIVGVATSITAFVGRASFGPADDPTRVQSFGEYERLFGGLSRDSTMSYAVQQFFLNGGSDALIVRVVNGGATAQFTLPPDSGAANLVLDAASPGIWANNLTIAVDFDTKDAKDANPTLFNLTVTDTDPVSKQVRNVEVHRNLSVSATNSRFVGHVLEQESSLLDMHDPQPAAVTIRPKVTAANAPIGTSTAGDDGSPVTVTEITGVQVDKTGIFALEKADLFNLLVLPPPTFDAGTEIDKATWDAAAAYCEDRRAVLLVDAPDAWNKASSASAANLDLLAGRSINAAVYFPRLQIPDPLQENRLATFAPAGVVAGLISRTDATRGVWKAPAGIDATLNGVSGLSVKLTDGEHGNINPLGINALRTFPVIGRVAWGARTRDGADQLASEWKYLPVRRLALFIEESLYRGTQWVVFEPNDEPLWAQIRLNLGSFMQDMFRQGAFQGSTPKDAFFVKCDRETTTQSDINQGIVNILVGFAPLKPAEFVIIKLQQMAGQLQA